MVTDGDSRTLSGESASKRGSDSRRSAGEEHGFAGEIRNDEAGGGHGQALTLVARKMASE